MAPQIDHQLLSVYLEDHLAGATAGLRLFRRTARTHRGTRRGPALTTLSQEVAEDRRAVLDLMRRTGVRVRRGPLLLAVLGEGASRLKPNRRALLRSPLSDHLEVEMLSLAVRGKADLWRTLLVLPLAHREQELAADMLARAEDQARRLADMHDGTARSALLPQEPRT